MILICCLFLGQSNSPEIRHNQLGFFANGAKRAVLVGATCERFQIFDSHDKQVLEGACGAPKLWDLSGEWVALIDFTELQTPGSYILRCGDLQAAFEIARDPIHQLRSASLKAFYLQRCSFAIDKPYGGHWSRPSGHPDDRVLVHASAASKGRPVGAVVSAPGGWYDAGDYNKYTVTTAFSLWLLMQAYADFPGSFQADLNIPESGNLLPDLLDEVLVGLTWLMTMQDPFDGGVYHKLTSLDFEGMIMPNQAKKDRYVVAKSTVASLDFAAVMAQASRVFATIDGKRSAAFLVAAKRAWGWALKNPNVVYQQPADVRTGTYVYDHEDGQDEWFWAAAELFVSTGDTSFLKRLEVDRFAMAVPSWDYVAPLALMTLAKSSNHERAQMAKAAVREFADVLVEANRSSPYGISMGAMTQRHQYGKNEQDFSWGSNGMAANHGLVLLQAFILTDHRPYRQAAIDQLDYLLGRNPLAMCYVTGFGRHSPQAPHHRPSVADGVVAPIPGFLVGGPHAGGQDKAHCPEGIYPSDLPAKAYVDHACSYATNEVAINWNAGLVYLSAGLTPLD